MRKVLVLLLVAAMVMGIVVLAGCGEKKVTIEDDEGSVDVTEKDGEATITGEKGEKYRTKEIDEKDLGIPIYPGTKVQEGTAASVTPEDTDESRSIAILETKDSVSKVSAWYKDKLSGKPGFTDTSMASEGVEVGMFSFQDGDQLKSVIVGLNDETGMTEIVLSSASGDLMTPGSTE